MSESDRTSFCCEGGMAPPRSGRSKLRGQMPKAYANEATATGRVLEHERPDVSWNTKDRPPRATAPPREGRVGLSSSSEPELHGEVDDGSETNPNA